MVRINSISTSHTERANAKKKKSGVSSSAFSNLLDEAENISETAASAPVTESAPVSGINPMLGLQEISDEEVQRKKLLKQGKQTVESLHELQHALLTGSVPASLLERLDGYVQEQRQESTDPQLDAILDDIELRAAVEMAKLEKARSLKG